MRVFGNQKWPIQQVPGISYKDASDLTSDVQSSLCLTSIYMLLAHLPICTLLAPQNFAIFFSISLGTAAIPRRNEKQRLCKIGGGGGGGITRCILGDVQVAYKLF